jgi:hypothetical protein
MKECKRYRDMFDDVLYNEAPESYRKAFFLHLKKCHPCSSEYEKISSLLNQMDKRRRPEMKEEFWGGYWARLESRMKDESVPKGEPGWWETLNEFFSFKYRWAMAPVAAILLVVVGIGIGRYISIPSGRQILNSALAPIRQFSPAVAEHFDNMKPLLIDYSNAESGIEETTIEEPFMVDKGILKKLVLQNYLLKKAVANSNDPSIKQLLDDMELVLIELSNSEGNEEELAESIKNIIKRNDMLFKMKIYKNKGIKPSTI